MAGFAPASAGDRAARLGLVTILAIGAATAAAHIGNNFTTYLVGGLVDRFGFLPGRMGLFSMAETLSYAAAMFVVAPRAAGLSARRLGMISTVLVVAAQGGSALLSAYWLLVAARVAAGMGFGLMNSAVNLAAGRTAHPARAISAGITIQTLLYAGLNIALPRIGVTWGVAGEFAALAGLAAVFGAVALALPAQAGVAPASAGIGARHDHGPIGADGRRILVAMALFASGSMAIWPFMERAAHAIGLAATAFGQAQSIATLLSAGSNAVLAAIVSRIPRAGPLAGALLVCGGACAVMTTVGSPAGFAVALVIYNASWFVVYPLLLSLAYGCDGSGRLAVMTTATWLLSISFGSLGAGYIAQASGSYGYVGMIGFGACLAAIVATWPLARRLDRG